MRAHSLVAMTFLMSCGKVADASSGLVLPDHVVVETDQGVHVVCRLEQPKRDDGTAVRSLRLVDEAGAVLATANAPADAGRPTAEGRNLGLHLLLPAGTKNVGWEVDLGPSAGAHVLRSREVKVEKRTAWLDKNGTPLDVPRNVVPEVAWARDAGGLHIACGFHAAVENLAALRIRGSDGALLGERVADGKGPTAGGFGVYVLAPPELREFSVELLLMEPLGDGQPWPVTGTMKYVVDPRPTDTATGK